MKSISLLASTQKWRAQAWYVPLLAIAMGLMMLRPLLMARMFDASGFATYSAGVLVSSTFCTLGCLGLQSMLQRKMPMDFVAGKQLASLVLLVQGMIVAVLCVVLISGLGFSGVSVAGLSSEGFAISLLHGLSQQLFVLATIESRSRGEPLRFSFQYLIRAGLVVTGAGIVASYTLSPHVTLLVEAVLSLLVVWRVLVGVLVRQPTPFGYLAVLAVRRMTKIRWQDAFSLMAVMLIGFALTNVDRWLAATWLKPQQFAWYAFAWILLATAQSVQSIINSSVYPTLARRCAANGRSSSFRLAAQTSVLFLGGSALLAWPAYYVLKVLILTWFAEYSASLQLVPIFLAVAIVRVSDFWSSYLIVIGRERLLLAVNVTVGVVVFVVWIGSVMTQFDFSESGAGGLLRLSWLALAFTIFNYIFVMFAAFRFRFRFR